jgi:hypothetical protein
MEYNYTTIKYNNKNINILKFLSESNNQFNQRLEYIKKLEINGIKYNEVNNLSMIWYCIKFKNCKYNYNIHNRVLSFEK